MPASPFPKAEKNPFDGREKVGWPGSRDVALAGLAAAPGEKEDPANEKPPLDGGFGSVAEEEEDAACSESTSEDIFRSSGYFDEAAAEGEGAEKEGPDAEGRAKEGAGAEESFADAGGDKVPAALDVTELPAFRFCSAFLRKSSYFASILVRATERSAKGSLSISVSNVFVS